ncbi:integrase [Vibrio splendidus]|uniref:integrase n=1 Tax=Vibrio splendidus TaxID=29497 RepID=UPI000D385A32|nr:integrase [Vibrio splendidus]PTP35823.1 integrase [Vibrio splendidus]
MLSVSIDNSSIDELIEDIVQDHSMLHGINSVQLEEIIDYSIANNDYRVLNILANIHTGIYDYDERQPAWLASKFYEQKWVLKLGTSTRIIHWDTIYLEGEEKLTDTKHIKLLNSFKYWVVAADNPLENGGKIISIRTAKAKVSRIISLINAILLHSKELKLAKYHLQNVSDDFWLNILMKFAIHGNFQGVYEFDKRTKTLLNNITQFVTDKKSQDFVEKYPYTSRTITKDETLFSIETRGKACAWLFEKGYYKRNTSTSIDYKGIGSVLSKLLFEGKVLYHDIKAPSYPELALKKPKPNTEYGSVNDMELSPGTILSTISVYIESIKLIHTNLGRKDAATPPHLSERVNADSISKLVSLNKAGRTHTLSPHFVFKLINRSYEFAKEHLPTDKGVVTLLDEVLNILTKVQNKSKKEYSNSFRPLPRQSCWDEKLHRNMPGTERGYWLQTQATTLLSDEYQNKGVKQILHISENTQNRFKRIRANESLFDLFSILQGAIQVLIGAIMARRQDELIKLKPHGNLSPNISPFIGEDSKKEYNLIFKVKKTGSNGINATIERPIPLSIAKFIWQLEQFNIKASKLKLTNSKLSLFNNLDSNRDKLNAVIHSSYNQHLDALCDYFETDLVKYDNDDYRRNYVRQHQLRRFFAMVFFWSKSTNGLDSLRWMLGHSDLRHLYHYISESETGAVLNGAKASVIVRGVVDSTSELAKLEGVEEVRKIIAERLTGDSSTPITIESVSEAAEDYDDESYLTVPHISQLQKEQDIETEIIQLLEEGRITLEPEFFTIEDADGNTTQTFNLILKIKDLD